MLLDQIEKPGRYIGGEVGAVTHKDGPVRLHVALAFPDVYEIGMSHLGLKILYHLINGRPEYWAERVMAPWTDMEARLVQTGQALGSLETGRPLYNFDVVGFSLQYELSYTNVLTMLERGGIPIRARDRGPGDPLVVAGGPGAFNPEPMAEVFDFVFLGDAEAGWLDVLDRVADWKKAKGSRAELFHDLAGRPGVYIPSLFEPRYDESGRFREIEPLLPGYDRVIRAIAPDIDSAPFPTAPIVPFTQPVHDRIAVEIARGCTRGCRFCQAGFIYRPVRERKPATVLSLMDQALKATGYEEASFLSLSAGDYSCLLPTMAAFMEAHGPQNVSLSLPSLRVRSLNPEMMRQIKRVRKTGFTLAPEAGAQRLRDVINKDLTEDDLMTAARNAFSLGWRVLKLYFMIGLPTETEDDRRAIADLCRQVRAGTRGQIHVSYAVFVPKVWTPFQWEAMPAYEAMTRWTDQLRGLLDRPGLTPKWNQVEISLVEGILARGDRRLFPVIRKVQAQGARFDAWSDKLRLAPWLEAMAAEGFGVETYTGARDLDAPLPWSHLGPRVTEAYLRSERAQAYRAAGTPDCRDGGCLGCGVCDFETIEPRLALQTQVEGTASDAGTGSGFDPNHTPAAGFEPVTPPEPGASVASTPTETIVLRARVRYTKEGEARWLSHLETVDVFRRAVRRAGLTFRTSQGFHPQPRISFLHPLPVGVAGLDEWMDMELVAPPEASEAFARLKTALPKGFGLLGLSLEPLSAPRQRIAAARYRVDLAEGRLDETLLVQVLTRPEIPVLKKGKKGVRRLDLKLLLGPVSFLTSRSAELTLSMSDEGGLRPLAALAALQDENPDAPPEAWAEVLVVKLETLLA